MTTGHLFLSHLVKHEHITPLSICQKALSLLSLGILAQFLNRDDC